MGDRRLFDKGWKFCFGDSRGPKGDFNHGTQYFNYLTKAGYGDGPAAPGFDDRAWLDIDLPHDWAVALDFDPAASHSHGYKALGPNFPERSVGWYRRSFSLPADQDGRRHFAHFEGAFRDSRLWVNGFYCGREESGYLGFRFDISDYLNYGGENVMCLRVDASMEEGWFYEGAGIYRHVWLESQDSLAFSHQGLWLRSRPRQGSQLSESAILEIEGRLENASSQAAACDVALILLDPRGTRLASSRLMGIQVAEGAEYPFSLSMEVESPLLWDLESPNLYRLRAELRGRAGSQEQEDSQELEFGIRQIRFDPDRGFFLNGRRRALRGANNHQDHAGLGVALPEAIEEFRLRRLKEFGCNAYRCSHHPPSPSLLSLCDRLGILVIDENRLMGTSEPALKAVERMMVRDRNHPCVILWSLGNEEWAIEGNDRGRRMAERMMNHARRFDSSRPLTFAISGGWGQGISQVAEVMGYNYIMHGSTDEQHAQFPRQPGLGTEETTIQCSRDIYQDDRAACRMAPLWDGSSGGNAEKGLMHYAEREYLAGLFYWTGFDYRGEPVPFSYPAVLCQFGILDLCGFPKESYYYLAAWWSSEPRVFISPYWDWPGREGQGIRVRIYSNQDEVALFLNGEAQGRWDVPPYGHVELDLVYNPGLLEAKAYRDGLETAHCQRRSPGAAAGLRLSPSKTTLRLGSQDDIVGQGEIVGQDAVAVDIVCVDAEGHERHWSSAELSFDFEGPIQPLGVGNGDCASLEPECFRESMEIVAIGDLRSRLVAPEELPGDCQEVEMPQAGAWEAFRQDKVFVPEGQGRGLPQRGIIIRGGFELIGDWRRGRVSLYPKCLAHAQCFHVNGRLVSKDSPRDRLGAAVELDPGILKDGWNEVMISGLSLEMRQQWEELPLDPGCLGLRYPAGQWRRRLFMGKAQIILGCKAGAEAGSGSHAALIVSSPGLESARLELGLVRGSAT